MKITKRGKTRGCLLLLWLWLWLWESLSVCVGHAVCLFIERIALLECVGVLVGVHERNWNDPPRANYNL